MLADFGLLNDLGRFAFSPTRAPMRVYGDPAYPLRTLLQGQFRRAHLTLLMKAYNTAKSTVRTSVLVLVLVRMNITVALGIMYFSR